jgi:hypothetical protein
MCNSAEIKVVETLGSPNRLKRSSVTSKIRSAVRRGAFLTIHPSPQEVNANYASMSVLYRKMNLR